MPTSPTPRSPRSSARPRRGDRSSSSRTTSTCTRSTSTRGARPFRHRLRRAHRQPSRERRRSAVTPAGRCGLRAARDLGYAAGPGARHLAVRRRARVDRRPGRSIARPPRGARVGRGHARDRDRGPRRGVLRARDPGASEHALRRGAPDPDDPASARKPPRRRAGRRPGLARRRAGDRARPARASAGRGHELAELRAPDPRPGRRRGPRRLRTARAQRVDLDAGAAGLGLDRIPGHKITILETYQQGSIKITRRARGRRSR